MFIIHAKTILLQCMETAENHQLGILIFEYVHQTLTIKQS